jgi:hypothetical protein
VVRPVRAHLRGSGHEQPEEHQRPELDRYASRLFLTAYAVDLDEGFRMDKVVERWDAS